PTTREASTTSLPPPAPACAGSNPRRPDSVPTPKSLPGRLIPSCRDPHGSVSCAVPSAGAAGRRPWWGGDRRWVSGSAVGIGSVGPGAAGRLLLAHQPDDAPDRPLFGVSHPAAHRVIDTLGPLLALAPVRRRGVDHVSIVDGTLIP